MAIFDDLTEQEIKQNKAIRGYIVRALAKGSNNSLLVRQITNALLADNLITVPDISKQLSYLEDGLHRLPQGRGHSAHEGGGRSRRRHDGRPGRRCLKANAGGHG